MRNLFPGYYRPTNEEFAIMWQECIFAFDANVLLNIYRYSSGTRDELFDVFEKLKDRIWIPYQAMLEYHENREEVISQQYTISKDIEIALTNASDTIETKYKRGHPFTDTKIITDVIQEAIEKIKTLIADAESKYPNLLQNDYLLERLTHLFDNRIGNEYPVKRLDEIYKEFEQRYKLQIPPGYRDKNPKKEGFKKYGDGVLWYQVIDYAKSKKKPIILITDDQKDDWWRIEKGETLGPRPELVAEISSKAKVNFYIYNASQFLKYAKEFLGLQVKQEAIDEVSDVSQQDAIGSHNMARLTRRAFQAESAVQLWLTTAYLGYEIVFEPRNVRFNFLLLGSDGTQIGVEIKYKESFYYLEQINQLLEIARDSSVVQALDKFLIILVSKNEVLANDLLSHFPPLLSIPINTFFLIGYLNPEGQFSLLLRTDNT